MNPHLKGSLLIAGSMMFYALIGPFVRWLELPVAIIMIYVSLFVAVIYSWYFLICQKSPLARSLLQLRVRGRFLSMLKNTPRPLGRRFLTFVCLAKAQHV